MKTKHSILLLLLTLAVAPTLAQEHQHSHAADTARAMPPDQETSQMEAMMQMHERMMADSVLHRHMMADSSMRTLMRPMMGEGMNAAAMREHMAAMTPTERQEMHQQMMDVHRRMMADSTIQERIQVDPEMRRMMESMMEDHGMDHDQMEGMDYSQMEMDHGQMEGMQHERHQPAPTSATPMKADDARAAEAASRTADRFHAALASGDRAAVEALLLPDAVVLEGGQSEARAEYLGGHFGSDVAFLAAVERAPVSRRTTLAGDAAWVASTSRLSGTYEGQSVDLDSAELLVLRRDEAAPDGWRIAAVHWSSQDRH